MAMKLFVATTNPGKLRDFASAVRPGISLEPLPGLRTIAPPPEDSPTFDGNAEAKAAYYSLHAPGQIVLADDSGLEVDALNGAPGVRSARYAIDTNYPAHKGQTLDARNNACLLHALAHIGAVHRQARYRCALAAARDGEILRVCEGHVEGEILTVPRGSAGFGYDPLFFLSSYGKTMAELDAVTKLAWSHRGNALRALLAALSASHEP
jgi:XTP/dITP diphosphohydrolase